MLHVKRLHKVRTRKAEPWELRHQQAVNFPTGQERGYIGLLKAWLSHADEHRAEHGDRIGNDGYCGSSWARIGSELIHLLSGPTGNRLNGGTLDSVIREALAAEGYNANEL